MCLISGLLRSRAPKRYKKAASKVSTSLECSRTGSTKNCKVKQFEGGVAVSAANAFGEQSPPSLLTNFSGGWSKNERRRQTVWIANYHPGGSDVVWNSWSALYQRLKRNVCWLFPCMRGFGENVRPFIACTFFFFLKWRLARAH